MPLRVVRILIALELHAHRSASGLAHLHSGKSEAHPMPLSIAGAGTDDSETKECCADAYSTGIICALRSCLALAVATDTGAFCCIGCVVVMRVI